MSEISEEIRYYATHQYFLSKRSLYLVLWKITDGCKGLSDIIQWLGNIQARAPNSPVIIVGTHYDLVGENIPIHKFEELQQIIREKFVNITDAEKNGLPRVIDSIQVSCRTCHNLKLLSNLIYDAAFMLKSPGSKEPLLMQRIPASYIALEDIIGIVSYNLKSTGIDPVLDTENYRNTVMEEMKLRHYKGFRDYAELNQATMFLHDNGVILHYDDAILRDFYFLDPQWLCDMLAHVVTVREINPFAKAGIMKLDDLQLLFKNTNYGENENRRYIVNLLNKFEVALTWDFRTLLIPSLLPANEINNGSGGAIIKIFHKSRELDHKCHEEEYGTFQFESSKRKDYCYPIKRILVMTYFPSGFWSRLITRLMADDKISEAIRNVYWQESKLVWYSNSTESTTCHQRYAYSKVQVLTLSGANFYAARVFQYDQIISTTNNFKYLCYETNLYSKFQQPNIGRALKQNAEWNLWQTGLALYIGNILVFKVWEVPFDSNYMYRNNLYKFKTKIEGQWNNINISTSSILEITFPLNDIQIVYNMDSRNKRTILKINYSVISQLLAITVDHIDLLLEDWYPSLGTRFVHTSEGRFLVTRIVPCPKCLECINHVGTNLDETSDKYMKFAVKALEDEKIEKLSWKIKLRQNNKHKTSEDSAHSSDGDSGVGQESASSSRNAIIDDYTGYSFNSFTNLCYSWMIEECILSVYNQTKLICPLHAEFDLMKVAPDVVFADVPEKYTIQPVTVVKGSLLGRGAFGFVFKATCKVGHSRTAVAVAMKVLQPVSPGPRARESATLAYKAAIAKWDRDPLQHSCKAYCTARQELSVLFTLKHPNIVPLVGVCIQPLALVLELAPYGALDSVLRHYKRSGSRICSVTFQIMTLQAARAIEYLHRRKIIYRDLKSENVLVWKFPMTKTNDGSKYSVHIKIADYGISRTAGPTGLKGFGGTEGFMAPEIIRYNGEEEYTEKVDCFSFGMFLYEIITLRQPFEGHESIKECILEGRRPSLTLRETYYPSYCLDLMVLCWDESPKKRPSASQIVSILSAPEYVHLLDVVLLQNEERLGCGAFSQRLINEDERALCELWLPHFKSRIEVLSTNFHQWCLGRNLSCENVFSEQLKEKHSEYNFRCCCIVEEFLWIGDSSGNLHVFKTVSSSHYFSYMLDPSTKLAVTSLIYLRNIKRVMIGLINGRIFLVDTTKVPTNYAFAEGSFVLTELCSGEILNCATAVWYKGEYQLWCGEMASVINIFPIKDSIVSGKKTVNHDDIGKKYSSDIEVSQLHSTSQFVFSCLKPGFIVFQWNVSSKEIENKLDCSKLLPCSESLKSISLEEHLSTSKWQISALAINGNEVYIGTTWGCMIVADATYLRPITVFRPYEREISAIIPCNSGQTHLIATLGRKYRSLIQRYIPEYQNLNFEHHLKEKDFQKGKPNFHCILWKATDWS